MGAGIEACAARHRRSHLRRPRARVRRRGERSNLAKLDTILASLAKLADPRKLAAGEQDGLIAHTPAVAWLGYSIHGDEMSGVDGGLALAYHLIAGTSRDVKELLDQVVVVIDPMQNPDGRERFLSLLLQMNGATPVLDGDALSHGRWPYGRGNHYLFDMNRDWIAGIAPETRGRWTALQRFHPQLFVDAHEMGRDDSYLFYPQADPINPHLPTEADRLAEALRRRHRRVLRPTRLELLHARVGRRLGTVLFRLVGSLNSAIGVLYEQARFDGQTVKLQSGEIATYREAVAPPGGREPRERRVLARNREARCANSCATLPRHVRSRGHRGTRSARTPPDRAPWLVVERGANSSRNEWLLRNAVAQGIEVRSDRRRATLHGRDRAGRHGTRTVALTGPLWVIAALQAAGRALHAPSSSSTRAIRRPTSSASARSSRPRQLQDLRLDGVGLRARAATRDAWWCDAIKSDAKRSTSPRRARKGDRRAETADAHVYGWLVDGADDASVVFACDALELGLEVNFSDEPFQSCGPRLRARQLARARARERANAAELVAQGRQARARASASPRRARALPVRATTSAASTFHCSSARASRCSRTLRSRPTFGHLWHQLDRELGLAVSLLDAQDLGSYDLRHYKRARAAARGRTRRCRRSRCTRTSRPGSARADV
jgi:hypothetical protein